MKNIFHSKGFLFLSLLIIIIGGFYFNPTKAGAICVEGATRVGIATAVSATLSGTTVGGIVTLVPPPATCEGGNYVDAGLVRVRVVDTSGNPVSGLAFAEFDGNYNHIPSYNGSYIYSISISGLASGSYKIKARSCNGACSNPVYSPIFSVTGGALSPSCTASVTPTSGTAGTTSFNFTGTASGGSGTYSAWNWTFGDGNTGNTQNPTHTYASASPVNDPFSPALTVTDSAGLTSSPCYTHSVAVSAAGGSGTCGTSPATCMSGTLGADNGLTACGTTRTWNCGTTNCSYNNPVCGANLSCSITATPSSGTPPLNNVSLSATGSGGAGSYTYKYNCTTNGSYGTTNSCNYANAGSYTPWGQVTDSANNTATCGTLVTVSAPLPDLTAGAPTPTNATANVAQTYTSVITNMGASATSAGMITHLFQFDDDAIHTSGVTATTTTSTGAIAVNGSTSISVSHTFASGAGNIRYMRVCADNDASFQGSVTESNEYNNCSPWTSISLGSSPLPDLVAGVPSPISVVAGVATTYTSIITNQGDASTCASGCSTNFSNFFQTSTSATGTAGTVTDWPASQMGILAAGAMGVATSPEIILTTGTKYVRACADKTSSAGGGIVTESNENNNCGAWTAVSVGAVGPSGTISATDCTISLNASTCGTKVTWITANLTSGSTEVTRNNPEGTHVSSLTSGTNVDNTVNYGQSTFFLYHNISGIPTILAQKTIIASCATGTVYDYGVKKCKNATSDYWTFIGVSCPASCIQTATCVDADGNGILNCPAPAPTQPCTGGACSVAPVNGKCDLKHYKCSAGTPDPSSFNPNSLTIDGRPEWTWVCLGSGKKHTDALCSELKRTIDEK